jgi:hypothetical protein
LEITARKTSRFFLLAADHSTPSRGLRPFLRKKRRQVFVTVDATQHDLAECDAPVEQRDRRGLGTK